MDEDITIGCPQHGGFITTPEEHLKGYGCPNCRHEDIIRKDLKELYDRLEYWIICIEHETNADDNKTSIQAEKLFNSNPDTYKTCNI